MSAAVNQLAPSGGVQVPAGSRQLPAGCDHKERGMRDFSERRPTSQEVAEIFVEHGSLDAPEYRDALRCHFGNCYHAAHEIKPGEPFDPQAQDSRSAA